MTDTVHCNLVTCYNENADLRAKNAELQKQVDELTDKLGKVLLGIKADEVLIARGVEKSIKDTANEIFKYFENSFSIYYPHGQIPYSFYQAVLEEIATRKGVEVE